MRFACYERQVELAEGGSLVSVDWLTAGRLSQRHLAALSVSGQRAVPIAAAPVRAARGRLSFLSVSHRKMGFV
jgi:hypothetical protein